MSKRRLLSGSSGGDRAAFENRPTAGVRGSHESPEPRNPGQVGHARRCCGSAAQLRHGRPGSRAVQSDLALVPLPQRAFGCHSYLLIVLPSNTREPSAVHQKLSSIFIEVLALIKKARPLCNRKPPLRLSCRRRNLVDAWRSITASGGKNGADCRGQ